MFIFDLYFFYFYFLNSIVFIKLFTLILNYVRFLMYYYYYDIDIFLCIKYKLKLNFIIWYIISLSVDK